MEQIKEKIEAYKGALRKIQENRNLWSNKVKQLIYDTLIEVKKVNDLDWQVQKLEMLKNLEAVNIHFNKQASGLIETDGRSIKNHTKYGGALIFSQAYNGQVFIIYRYPYVEDWVEQLDNKLISKELPENISRQFILQEVGKFLDEMIVWETSRTNTKIGFLS
jgi:hypothetical protein